RLPLADHLTRGLLDAVELDREEQRRVRLDARLRAALLAVPEVRRDDEEPADVQRRPVEPLEPPLDEPARLARLRQARPDRLAPRVVARVEQPVLERPARVVREELVPRRERRRLRRPDVDDHQPALAI